MTMNTDEYNFDYQDADPIGTDDGWKTHDDGLFREDVGLSDMFSELTMHLMKTHDIDKGVLVLRNSDRGELSAVSTWNRGAHHDGLQLNLPIDASLFEKVAEGGCVYTEDFCQSFSGNFFERKLLLDDDSRSFVLQPLKSNGRVLGLLGYSSARPTAFATFEEGVADDLANRFGAMIESKTYQR